MKQEINKTINLDIEGYESNENIIIGLFTYIAMHEGWSEEESNIVIDEALRLQDYDHFMETIKSHCEVRPKEVTPKKLSKILDQLGMFTHYLATKDIWLWDKYDYSNYRSLAHKAGLRDKVYSIYRSDVSEEDKYRVTTHPSLFFDTEEEAKDEVNHICSQIEYDPTDFIIYPLYRLPE